MAVTFQVAPILSDPYTLSIPVPAEIEGKWSWLQRESVSNWMEEIETIFPTDAKAELPDLPAAVREGWLKLSEALGGGKNQ